MAKRLTMKILRVTGITTNKTGATSFYGDAPVIVQNNPNNKKSGDEFYKQACKISGGILALALIARLCIGKDAGIFRKKLPGVAEDIKSELKKVRKKPVEQEFIRIFPLQEERLAKTELNPDDFKSVINYKNFNKCNSPIEQNDFFKNISSVFDGMSYEDQYEQFDCFLDFLKNIKPLELDNNNIFKINAYKLDNKTRISEKLDKFLNSNPEYKFLFGESSNYSRYELAKTPAEKAAFFTNTERKIQNLKGDVQLKEFDRYLEFIKTLDFKESDRYILFTLGKYDGENNIEIAKKAIQFIKDNPQYKNQILSDLIAYEPDSDFSRSLVYSGFGYKNEYKGAYDFHVDNIIKIRNLLTESKINCDNVNRLKNRQDWIDIKFPTANRYMLGFQYSPRISEIRKAAFEYDLMQGITKEDADFMIERLSSDTSVAKKTINEVIEELKADNIKTDNVESLFNSLIENSKKVNKKISELQKPDINKDDIEKQIIFDNNLAAKINSKIYEDLEKIGIDRQRAEKIYQSLISTKEHTDTEIKYGMSLNEMIEKIKAAVI